MMEVTATLVTGIADLSRLLENTVGHYFLPEQAGWWMPMEMEPILREGREYWVQGVDDQGRSLVKKVQSIRDLHGFDVFDKYQNIVVPANRSRQLREVPFPYSARMIRLIEACTEHMLHAHAAWGSVLEHEYKQLVDDEGSYEPGYGTVRREIDQILDEHGNAALNAHPMEKWEEERRGREHVRQVYLRPLNKHVPRHKRAVEYNFIDIIRGFVYSEYEQDREVLESIDDCLLDYRTEVSDFLGKDRWIMHFHKRRFATMHIEKTVDYRIMIWMQQHGLWE